VALAGQPRLTLAALAEALASRVDAAALDERRQRWHVEHRRLRDAWAVAARQASGARPIEMTWLSRAVGDLADDRTIIVNEYDLDATQACVRVPGSYYGSPASSALGWGLGAALGAKLAAPERTVIACVGDGAYIFGAPTAAHWVARAYDLPVLWVIFNNRTWNAVKRSVLSYAKDGWAARTDAMPLTSLEPAPDYELVCRASGGHAERVEDPAALPEALQRAKRVVSEEKRQALVNVICRKP
jgi:acetolactate synthase-1/2/3 large subunit